MPNSVSHFGNDFLDPGQEVCDVSVDTGGALARASFAIRHNTSEVETPLPLADKRAARVSLQNKMRKKLGQMTLRHRVNNEIRSAKFARWYTFIMAMVYDFCSSSSSSIFIDTQFTGVFSWGALGSLTSL